MAKVLTILSGLDGGGVETILLNYLQKFDLQKIQMDIIVHSREIGFLEETYEKLGCKIHRVTPKSDSILKNYYEINKIIKQNNYDVIHSRMDYRGVTHMLAGFICKVPVRITHTHIANLEMNGSIFKKLTKTILCKVTKFLATNYMACSKAAAIDMFGKKMVEENKVTVLKNALNLNKYTLSKEIRENYRNKFGIKNNHIVIGMVGRFHPQKNHEFMIKIFEKIASLNKNYVLMLVGGGENIDQYKSVVENNEQIRSRVIFTGIRNDVPNLLQAMDIFVLPSKYEGFGNVFIEAQVSGLLTIASDAVPKETKITDLISYLSLKESSDYWANYILKFELDKIIRKNFFEEARNAGFDIVNEAEVLENTYCLI